MAEGGGVAVNVDTMTLDEIKQAGLEALFRKLGPVGMVRFLQQFETGEGDYSVERHRLFAKMHVRTLAQKIRAQRKRRCAQPPD